MKTVVLILFIILSSGLSSCNGDSIQPEAKMIAGVFGGSVCSYPGSEIAHKIWMDSLGITVESNGVGGAGFSTRTGPDNICNQITKAKPYDIYILWASTNDIATSSIGVFNSDDIRTQSGGIRKAVKLIKKKNENALILFLTSLPRFDSVYAKCPQFIEGQKKVCENLNIPYFEQEKYIGITYANYQSYYIDFAHPNHAGYEYIAKMQLGFLREHITKYYKIWTSKYKQE